MSSNTYRKPETLAEALELLRQDAEAKGVDKLTMEEIDAEIAAHRREQREKKEREKLAG